MAEISIPEIFLPNTGNTLVPDNTLFYLPIADVPYLDPLLLPSLEQVESGLANEKESSQEKESSEIEEVTKIKPPTIPTNIPKNTFNTEQPVATFDIPFFGAFPVPAPEVIASSVISAGVASTVAVGGSIAAQAVVSQLKKIMKKIFTKVLKKEVKDLQTKKD